MCDELYPVEKDVLVLEQQNFGFAMGEFKYILILFYSPDDPNCQDIIPLFEETASLLKKENYVSGKVDIDKAYKIVRGYNIDTVPSIHLFIKTSPTTYEGEKKKEKIIEWVKEQTKKEYKKIKTSADVEELKKEGENSLIYFGKNEKVVDEIVLADRKIEDIPIGTCDSDELIKKFAESDDKKEFIVLFTRYDGGKKYLYDLKADKIIDFYNLYFCEKVNEFNTKTSTIGFVKRFNFLVIFSERGTKNWDQNWKLLEKLWPKLKTKLKLFVSNVGEGVSIKLSEYCGVKEEEGLPKAYIIEPISEFPLKYYLNDSITEEHLLKFVDDWENKKLKPFLRGEEEPEENDGDVLVVVRKTFKKLVLDNDKDVIIVFFAPWCKYCKNLYPGFEKMAIKLKDKNPKLIFAKIDATENDIEGINVGKYPTIKFYPGNAKDKAPIHFSNKLKIDEMLNLMKKYAYNKINDEDYVYGTEDGNRSTDL